MHSRIVDNTVLFILQIVELRCKDSANRAKYQIFLDISEVQPIFGEARGTNKRVETKFYLDFLNESTFDATRSAVS
jgi:hypothetical protein